MKTAERKAVVKGPKPGQEVVLKELPSGFLDDLPAADKRAICSMIGGPILLKGYDGSQRAELEFTEAEGVHHFIYVHPKFIEARQ